MKKRLLLAAVAATTLATAPAFAQAYSGGAATYTNLGDDGRNSGFDQVQFTSDSGTYTGAGVYNLNNITLTVGFNRNSDTDLSGVFTGLTGTFAGMPFSYDVNYHGTISAADTFIIGGNTIDVFGTPVYLNPITLMSGSAPVSGTLLAVVGGSGTALPEPATWAMMLVGFGMVGFGLRYRRKSAKVSFA